MNAGVSASTISGGIPRAAANFRSSSSIEKSGGTLVPRAILLLSFFSLTSTWIASSFFSLIRIQGVSGGIPVEWSGGIPVEFLAAACFRLRSRSHARRFSIIEVSTGFPVETALAAIASSSVATERIIASIGIPAECISLIILAIGVFNPSSPMHACSSRE